MAHKTTTSPSVLSPPVSAATSMSDKQGLPIAGEEAKDVQHSEADKGAPEEAEYPSFAKTLVIMGGLYLVMFLVALDRTIVATALPAISNEFDSLNDIGWYGSAYLLTSCAFQLTYGRIYTFYNPKWVYLACIILFEVGSVVSGAAPNSPAFIVGRAISGLGAAGLQNGGIVIILNILPLHKRSAWMGGIGAVFGIASVLGPLVGGAFTTDVTWRWCFYINLPIGAVTWAIVFFFVDLPNSKRKMTPFKEQLQRLDPIGTALFIPSIICLLLAVQWGGSKYAWSSGRIIALLTVFAVLLIAFGVVQYLKRDNATLPGSILFNRSIAAGMFYMLTTGATMNVLIYYLAIYFQAIKGVSAVQSGIRSLPLVLGFVLFSISAGMTIRRIGYYAPFMIASSILMSIGAGTLTLFKPETSEGTWIGLQIVAGAGIGLGMQQPILAAQTVLTKKDAPTGLGLMFFANTLGGAVFISVGQNVLTNELLQRLGGIQGVDAKVLVNAGATSLRALVPASLLGDVVRAYNGALVQVFYVAVGTACMSVIGAAAMEWKSTNAGKKAHEEAMAGKKAASAEEKV